MITEISYGSWESDPTILVYFSDGHMDGFVYMNDQWKSVHPADVATKASVIGQQQFEAIWPGLELPPSLAGWEETVHLLSSPRNAERLLASIRQVKAGRTVERELLVPREPPA